MGRPSTKITTKCSCCNKPIQVIPYFITHRKSNFCSRACYYAFNKKAYLGSNNPYWRGGEYKDVQGYLYVMAKNHPNVGKNGYIQKHRLVIEKHIGRLLEDNEVVDHINGIKDDNRIENLRVFANHSEHIKEEVARGKYKKSPEWARKIVESRERNRQASYI